MGDLRDKKEENESSSSSTSTVVFDKEGGSHVTKGHGTFHGVPPTISLSTRKLFKCKWP